MFKKIRIVVAITLVLTIVISTVSLVSAQGTDANALYAVVTKSLVSETETVEICPPVLTRSVRPTTPAYFPNLTQKQITTQLHETLDISAERASAGRYYVDAGESPYCAVGQLEITFRRTNGSTVGYIGTAFLEGPDVLFSAAHCAYDSSLGGWAESIDFYPARDGYDNSPYYASVISMSIAQSYADEGKDDWAILQADRDLGFLGWFGKGTVSSALINSTLQTSGYDGDKDGEQWESVGTVKRIGDNYDEDNVIMDLSGLVCEGGHSGGPIFDDDFIVWSNYTFGGGAYSGGGRAIDDWIYDMLQDAYLESIARYPQ